MRPVQLGAQPGAGGPVRQLHLDLGDPEALAQQVDGERGLHSPAARQRARARRATAPVPSREPSSTTTTRPTPGIPAAAATVWRMRSASFRAGMTTATSSAWDPADMGPILGEAAAGRVRLLGNGRLRPAPAGG